MLKVLVLFQFLVSIPYRRAKNLEKDLGDFGLTAEFQSLIGELKTPYQSLHF